MMSWKHARLVAYDISDNRQRKKLARFLLRKGMRLQESVFLVNVERHALDAFLKALTFFRKGDDDKIDVAPLCGNCRDRSVRIGQKLPSAIIVLGDENSFEKKVDSLKNAASLPLSSRQAEKPSTQA
jgi:CRISPR-associated protein Cas2